MLKLRWSVNRRCRRTNAPFVKGVKDVKDLLYWCGKCMESGNNMKKEVQNGWWRCLCVTTLCFVLFFVRCNYQKREKPAKNKSDSGSPSLKSIARTGRCKGP